MSFSIKTARPRTKQDFNSAVTTKSKEQLLFDLTDENGDNELLDFEQHKTSHKEPSTVKVGSAKGIAIRTANIASEDCY